MNDGWKLMEANRKKESRKFTTESQKMKDAGRKRDYHKTLTNEEKLEENNRKNLKRQRLNC
jgi:hypothetical protein